MTKTELEARVAELEAQIAGTGATSATISVPAGLSEAEVNAKIAGVKAEYESKISSLYQAKEEDDVAHSNSLSKLRQENMELITRVQELSDVISKKVPEILEKTGDGVVLGGVRPDIIFQDSVLELVDAWRKRFVDETDIAIVVKRK